MGRSRGVSMYKVMINFRTSPFTEPLPFLPRPPFRNLPFPCLSCSSSLSLPSSFGHPQFLFIFLFRSARPPFSSSRFPRPASFDFLLRRVVTSFTRMSARISEITRKKRVAFLSIHSNGLSEIRIADNRASYGEYYSLSPFVSLPPLSSPRSSTSSLLLSLFFLFPTISSFFSALAVTPFPIKRVNLGNV